MRLVLALVALIPLSIVGQPSGSMQKYNRAWSLVGQSRPDEALLVLKEILAEDPSFYRAYKEVIEAFRQKGDARGAKRFFEDLRSGFGRPEPHLLSGEILSYYASGQPRKALAAFQKCVSQLGHWPGCAGDSLSEGDAKLMLPGLKRILTADPSNGAARFNLGEVWRALGRYSEAVEAYQCTLRQGTEDLLFKMLVLGHLGVAVTDSFTDWSRGKTYQEQALQLALQLGDQEKELECLWGLMNSSFHLGDAEITRSYFERQVSRTREFDNPYALAQAYMLWGRIHREQGNADEAVEAYERALELLETLHRRQESAGMLRELADSEARRGAYQPALEHLDRAGQIARETQDRVDEAFVLRSRAEIYVQLGDYAKAIELHQRAKWILQDIGLYHSAGGTVGDLGIAYERLGDDVKAEECYRESLHSARRFVDVSEQERILTRLAELAVRRGNNVAAAQILLESLALSAQTGNARFRATTLLLLGRVCARLGNFPEALKNLHAGLDAAKPLKNTELEFMGAHGLGEVLLKSGRTAEAEREFREALTIGEQAGIPDAVRLAREGLGEVARHDGHPEDAAMHYRAAIESIESIRGRLESPGFKSTFLSGAINAYERLIDVLASQGNAREALYGAEKKQARAFLDTLVASKIQGSTGSADAKPLDAGAIEREVAGRGQVLIEYALGEKRSYMWVVSGSRTVMAALPARSLIEGRAERYRALLARQSPEATQEALALYHMLISPVASQLVPDRVLMIVTDGALHYIPFETLKSAPGRFFGEDFTIAYVPSASVLGQLRVRRPGPLRKELLAYGDPDFGTGTPQPGTMEAVVRGIDRSHGLRLTPLPNTRVEIEAIAALFPASNKTYLGRDASKTSVERERLDEYVRIHFATHAFIDEARPERSGIALSTTDHSDGVLRLKDILALKLNADLVVLSACQTGLGKIIRGEGIDGLTRAFLFAGTSRVVASLWDVNDIATTDLMKAFYRLMKVGLEPARALRAAKLEMMHSKVVAYHDPYFWAAFVLVGEP